MVRRWEENICLVRWKLKMINLKRANASDFKLTWSPRKNKAGTDDLRPDESGVSAQFCH
jgi:hypothetical protein